jgi:hypothetical protein
MWGHDFSYVPLAATSAKAGADWRRRMNGTAHGGT